MERYMPKLSLVQISDDTWEYPVDALAAKIRRHLRTLIPYRELYYNKVTCGYYARVMNLGQNGGTEQITHGPYYYVHMVGLARMTNAFGGIDRTMPHIQVYNRYGKRYPEQPLPKHLRFVVVTQALAQMCATLRGAGYTVQEPIFDPSVPGGVTGLYAMPPLGLPAPVTAEVTEQPLCQIEDEPESDPNDEGILELDMDEAERIMNGGGG
jgi:hypothetical protein